MCNQVKIELYKLKTSVVFYLILLAFAITGLLYGIQKMVPAGITGGQSLALAIGDTSFMFALTLFIGYFIGNGFSNRTINNGISIGYSRLSVVLSRAFVVLPATALFHLTYVYFTMIPALFANGFGTEMSVSDMLIRTVLSIFQVIAVQSIAVLVMFICKKSSLGIIVSVFITFVTCNILRNFLDGESLIFKYTSFYQMTMLAEKMTNNDMWISLVSAVLTALAVLCAACAIFRKAELR
jgi:ABC-type transport system involved in multi-copper enzyme maturation permease subunit